MAAIAERLFETEAAAAPSVDLIKYLRIFNFDWPWDRGDRLQCLFSAFAGIVLLDLSFDLDVEMRVILIVEWNSGILGFDDPAFWFNVFYFFEEEGRPAQQHHLILFTCHK